LVERNIPELQRRGRWKSAATLDHYVQLAGAFAGATDWSPEVRTNVERLAAPWTALLTTK
jgi:hypothetical protein